MPKYVNADNLLFEIKTGWWPQSTEYTNAIGILERMLTDAPAEDVEPVVHAHWVTEYWSSGYIKRCRCSNCGTKPAEYYDPDDYCRKCGAKMDAVPAVNNRGEVRCRECCNYTPYPSANGFYSGRCGLHDSAVKERDYCSCGAHMDEVEDV